MQQLGKLNKTKKVKFVNLNKIFKNSKSLNINKENNDVENQLEEIVKF